MEQEQQTKRPLIETYAVPILVAAALLGALALQGSPSEGRSAELSNVEYDVVREQVMPADGVELPVAWGAFGKRLVESGAIDREKWLELYGSLSEEEKQQLDDNSPERLRITRENAPYLLNLLWAFGLANKNSILEEGEMSDPAYGGAGGFASTGGWTLAKGSAMDHYSMHTFVTLTPEQQELVEKVSKNIYRPCCDNPTHFPDCNHGMAMLGLLELMASQGVGEEEMYEAALAANSYWFPDTYQTIATYMLQRDTLWKDVDAREVLGRDYSSASGYARIISLVAPRSGGGASCGV